MDAALLKSIAAYPELIKILDLHGIERAAAGFEIMLAASRDDHGHFYSPDGAPCPHKKDDGKPGTKGSNPDSRQKKYGKLANKLVRSSDAKNSINNPKGKTIDAVDGKPAIFNAQSVKHIVGDHSDSVWRKRMSEFYFAQNTVKTGKHFESFNKGRGQTEFIQKYDTGGGKPFYYTARRGNNGVVYSWHEITETNYLKKELEWKAQQR